MKLHRPLFAWTKKSTLFVALAAALGFGLGAQAQILVDATGTAALTFDATPTLTAAEWATASIGGTSAATYTTPADVDGGVQTVDQSTVNAALATITANGTSGGARHNTAGGYVVTQPTGVGAIVLKATLRNNTAGVISQFTVSYDFGVAVTTTSETAPGHRAFYSTTGLPNSWQPLANFSGLNAATAVSETISVGTWLPNTDIYLLWADDNGATNPDGGYTIDNFAVSGVVIGGTTVLSVALTAPSANQTVFSPATVALAATANGSTAANSVSFYTNGILYATDTLAPFDGALTGLPVGTYAIYATAENGGVDPVATSATRTITVRDEFVSFGGALLTENFDSMTTIGTATPTGWYVGAALPTAGTDVTVGDGTTAPSAAILGWNYGSTGDADRALGTAPTGADRNTQVRIQNNSATQIDSFEIHFDAEQWRVNTSNTIAEVLTNYVSYDNGATWIATGFDFTCPIVAPPGGVALNGKDAANREAGIGGTVVPPTSVPVGGVIYIRWQNFNDVGTDGAIAVDNFTFNANNVAVAVAITGEPTSVLALTNLPATFTVVATGTARSYYWYFNDSLVSSTAGASFTIPNVQPGDAGNYYVVVSNSVNMVTSAVVSLTVTQQVGWVAFNDQVSPSAKVTDLSPAGTMAGPLTNVLFGNQLPAYLTITIAPGSVATSGTMGVPAAGTPADTIFTPHISWTGGNAGLQLRTTGLVTYAFSGLDTTKTYKFSTTAVRAGGTGADYSNRWTQVELQGAASSTPGHSGGVITTADYPAFLSANQVAFNSGMNNTNLAGDPTGGVVQWDIVPSAGPGVAPTNGTFTIVVRQYTNATPYMPAGITPVPVNTYCIGQIRLEESLSTPAQPRLTIVQTDATHTMISWGADATGYTLQQNTANVGSPADWNNLGGVISGAGSTSVSFPPPDRSFFRLIK